MNITLPSSAFFLPPLKGENNGVDFLGLRQANLDMMAEMIPSTNNVTSYIRPFSLLCWIFWKFPALCAEAEIEDPSSKELKAFRERIEVLFTWGARLDNYPGIPGKQASPPISESPLLPLTFEAWRRVQSSTSLIAALWYGPAAKAVTGLGFLMPVPRKPGFFRVAGRGIDLAKALDEILRSDEPRYQRLLSTLKPVNASEDDARALWELWSPSAVTAAERAAFKEALFSEDFIGDYSSLVGKRSSTLALVRFHLERCGEACSADEIRRGMFLAQGADGSAYEVPEGLAPAHQKWVALQMRQLQRLSLEALLSWCEMEIIRGTTDTSTLSEVFVMTWRESDHSLAEVETLAEAIHLLDRRFSTLAAFIRDCREGTMPTPFDLMNGIVAELKARKRSLTLLCLYGVLFCVAFAGCLPDKAPELRLGGPLRLSFFHLRKRLTALGDMPIREAFHFIIEAMVVSQHFATAVNRFDGTNQRLRLAIEETGLCSLVSRPWQPNITEDRLPTLLSLAGECGLLKLNSDGLLMV